MNKNLDNRLYILRSSNLPEELRHKFVEADKLFIRDQNDECEVIINEIERECLVRNIFLYKPLAL
ncbi:MAG TPA: hypothetical protein VFC84_06080 [Desulfosporosinus sp.]|nr:hypothetical protein [Desulfosporosinus sp.]